MSAARPARDAHSREIAARPLPARPARPLSYREYLATLLDRPPNPVDQYLISLPSDESRYSMLKNLHRVARMLRAPFEEVPWGTMRFEHVEAVVFRMRQQGLAPKTISATVAALRGVARQARRLGQMGYEDFLKIAEVRPGPAPRRSCPRAVETRELALLLEACAADPNRALGVRDEALVALLVRGGLRRAEAARLTLADYDAMTHSLRVVGKGGRERWVHFEEGGARRAVSDWVRLRGRGEGALVCHVNKAGRVTGRALTGQAVYFVVAKRAREAGLDPVSPHGLRHTLGTDLLRSGADLATVQLILGHARVETTREYDQRRDETRLAALRKLKYPARPRGRKPRRGGRRRRRGGGQTAGLRADVVRALERRKAAAGGEEGAAPAGE